MGVHGQPAIAVADDHPVAQSPVGNGVLANQFHIDVRHAFARVDDRSVGGGDHRNSAFHGTDIRQANIGPVMLVTG